MLPIPLFCGVSGIRQMKRNYVLLAFLFLALSSFTQIDSSLTELNYVGSSTIANFIRSADNAFVDIKININDEPESRGGELAIVEGSTDIAGVARIPNPSILSKGVVSTLIGWDAIGVIVHPDIPVRNLSIEQLAAIFSGSVTNWNEVDGPDLAIVPLIMSEVSATRLVFRSRVLKEKGYSGCTEVAPDSEMLQKVTNTPGAIGQISYSFLQRDLQVNILTVNEQEVNSSNTSYPITRPLYLLWWPGNEKAAAFVDRIQTEGTRQLLSEHFIPNQQSSLKQGTGSLIFYTVTEPVLDAGNYYYPHSAYDIYSENGEFIRHVQNHRSRNDEDPEKVELEAGNYLVSPTGLGTGKRAKYLVNIAQNETTVIFIDELVGDTPAGTTPVPEQSKKEVGSFQFYGDFRFRAEQDWDSRKPDGSYRDDRTRLRIRLRLGGVYRIDESMSVKARLRTGYANNPQDPQITIGSTPVAYDNFPVMLDQAAFHYKRSSYWFWLGKDAFPFVKYSEVFWSDNVAPNGMAAGVRLLKKNKMLINFTAGYFVGFSNSTSLGNDAYILGGQLELNRERENCALQVPIALYSFQNFPLYPGTGSEVFDRHILQPSVNWRSKKFPLEISVETYFNLLEPEIQDSILKDFTDQLSGWNVVVAYGKLKEKGDYLISVNYAMIQQFSVMDYLAQNDWARWSYSAVGSPAGRLSNLSGMEIVVGWRWHKNAKLMMKYYPVQQLKAYGPALETNQRIRLDLDVKF